MARSLRQACGRCNTVNARRRREPSDLSAATRPGDLILADRYYCSYFLIALLMKRGINVLFQQNAMRKTDFRKGIRLGSGDHLTQWIKPVKKPTWMEQDQYDDLPECPTVREVKAKKKNW